MKFFKGKNKKVKVTQPAPRKLEEIDADHTKLQNEAAKVQYQVFALKRYLNSINEQLLAVNYERDARNKADKEESKNEQV